MVPVEQLLKADGDPFLGVTVAGRFVIVGREGAGSMGTVYRARQEPTGRAVAIKILRGDRACDPLAKARFTREAHTMSVLASPHTVTVFDCGEIPDPEGDELGGGRVSLYMAMELLEGEALSARLKRRGRLPVEEAVRIATHALRSLSEAHSKGIIHRDLKPDNLFLSRASSAKHTEVCKVLDFGIAKVASEVGGADALDTQAGTVFGTPRYMSPEQAQGKPVDARSDLYALGVLLYQMLVGRPPFVDDDAVVVMARHIKSTAVPPAEAAPDAGIAPALSGLVMRALAKDPAERPASAQAFLVELERATASRGARGGRGGGGVSSGIKRRRASGRERVPRSVAAAILGVTAALVLAVGLSARRPARAKPIPVRARVGSLVAARRLPPAQPEAASPPRVTSRGVKLCKQTD